MKRCKCGHWPGRHAVEGNCVLCKECPDPRPATGPMPLILEHHYNGSTHYASVHNKPMCHKELLWPDNTSLTPMTRLPSCKDCVKLAWSWSDEMYLDGVLVVMP